MRQLIDANDAMVELMNRSSKASSEQLALFTRIVQELLQDKD